MSFMDRKNILSEGFVDTLLNLLKNPLVKKAMKDPEAKKAFDKAMKSQKKTADFLDNLLRKQGIEPYKATPRK